MSSNTNVDKAKGSVMVRALSGSRPSFPPHVFEPLKRRLVAPYIVV